MVETIVAALASKTHGVVTRRQLLAAGVTRREPPPHVLAPNERRVPGVVTQRARRLDPADAAMWRGIPITTVPFTLVALAAELPSDDLARACREAGVRYGTTPPGGHHPPSPP